MTLRARPGDMEVAGNGVRTGNLWHYTTVHPIEDIETENYFLPTAHHIQPMDDIRVFQKHADGGWSTATFVVLHSETGCVIVQRDGDWRTFGLAIGGALEMIDRGNDRYDVIDTKNKRTIRKNLDRMTAAAVISAYGPKQIDPPMSAVEARYLHEQATAQQLAASRAFIDKPPASPRVTPTDPDEMNRMDLQKEMKALTGSGFHPSTDTEEMRTQYKAALSEKAAA